MKWVFLEAVSLYSLGAKINMLLEIETCDDLIEFNGTSS